MLRHAKMLRQEIWYVSFFLARGGGYSTQKITQPGCRSRLLSSCLLGVFFGKFLVFGFQQGHLIPWSPVSDRIGTDLEFYDWWMFIVYISIYSYVSVYVCYVSMYVCVYIFILYIIIYKYICISLYIYVLYITSLRDEQKPAHITGAPIIFSQRDNSIRA